MRHAGWVAFLAGLSVVSGCSQEETPRHVTLKVAPAKLVAQRVPAQTIVEKPAQEVPATVPQLEELLYEAPDPEIRREAVYLVADAGEAEDAALVGQALYDPDSRVRESAIEALTGIGGESSADWMLVALGDPDPHIRRTAVEALGEIGGDTAEILLRQSLLDADEGVREAAQQMLDEPKFAEEEIR
jgi:HEAT repeat protein